MQNARPAGLPNRQHKNTTHRRRNESGLWERNGAFKRTVDITLSVGALIVLSPIMIMISIAVWGSSKGPLIYRQDRIGRDGEVFPMYKFRTMYIDSDNVLHALLRSCPRSAEEWKTYQKLRFDPRITRIGSFLRKTSLDELPQLFNVVLGHMSLVGQRPILEPQIEAYGAEHFAEYVRARPGITGLWQVSGRNGLSFEQRAVLGTEYARNWSNRNDFALLLQTIPALLKPDDAF